jgi:hypothetical protein
MAKLSALLRIFIDKSSVATPARTHISRSILTLPQLRNFTVELPLIDKSIFESDFNFPSNSARVFFSFVFHSL